LNFEKLINFSYKCGYQAAFVNLISIEDYNDFIKSDFYPKPQPKIDPPIVISSILKYKSTKSPIPLIPKIIIKVESPEKLKQDLHRYIQKKALIAVQSSNKETLEVAARDGRVDLLVFDEPDLIKGLTPGIFSLAHQNQCAFDFSLTPIILAEIQQKPKLMRSLYRFLLNKKFHSHLYCVGSHTADPWLIRGPKETISLLCTLFNIPEFFAKKMTSECLETLVLRFIKRDQDLFVDSGVEIVQIEKPNRHEPVEAKKNG
jgi:RNase P/RNase MRP subunit p30